MNGLARFAEAWSDCLPENHRQALYSALCILSDKFFERDLEHADHVFRELLPRKYFHQYTSGFLRKFHVTLLTVGYKLCLPERSTTLLACTAEEIALHLLMTRASMLLDLEGLEADFDAFEEEVYQDLDFEYLYEQQLDGIEDSEIGAEMGIGHLRFREWFKPFVNASMPVHPLCQAETANDDADGLADPP